MPKNDPKQSMLMGGSHDHLRDRPPEFSKMKIFFGTSVSDTLKSVD